MPVFRVLTADEVKASVGPTARTGQYHMRHSYRVVPAITTNPETEESTVEYPDDPMAMTMMCDACGDVKSLGSLIKQMWSSPQFAFRITKRNREGQLQLILDQIYGGERP